jgi:L-amino acid N-acyltransferase YncA
MNHQLHQVVSTTSSDDLTPVESSGDGSGQSQTAVTESTESDVDMLTVDGGIVKLRPVRGKDRPALAALYQQGSLNSLVMRFFGPPGEASLAREIDRLTRPADSAHEVVIAEEGGLLVGVGAYERCAKDSATAEFALFVNEAHHGRGIGTLLLERLSTIARNAGIVRLTGEVLGSNNPYAPRGQGPRRRAPAGI